MRALVALDDVYCSYGGEPVLAGIDLTVERASFLGVVGPSGSGKTTLLKVIAGVLQPAAGRVKHAPGLTIGYVPQVESVNWHFPISVIELALMARHGHRAVPWPSRDDRLRAHEVLERLGLGGLARRHISELSGGQQQRAFIARALLRGARLLLLDEPTSGIDVRTRHDIIHLLQELHEQGLTIVLTTHDLNGVAAHLPTLVCLNRRVLALGPPREVVRPDVLERLYGAPLEVLWHAGMPVVLDADPARHTHIASIPEAQGYERA
jgi:ABC-type Mn2+/Zn2+ transport system ATPase subunit